MAKKLNKPIALFFTAFAVLVAALLHFGALDITTSAAWDGTIAEKFDGDGSEANPFEIANGEQLAYLAQQVNKGEAYSGKYFKLTANIDLGGNEWTPIGGQSYRFEGIFDGNGHTVSNFKINKPDDKYIGLFGYNNGTIMNLGVEEAEINGYNHVGGVCGYNDRGTIQNCYNTGAVSRTGSNIGGVCGVNNGTIQYCYNTGAVSGSEVVGGVCGDNFSSGTIQNCYNTGAVSGTNYVGGVCGDNDGGTIQNCYNTGAVSGTKYIGGVSGYNYSGSTIKNCYNTGAVKGESRVGGVCGYKLSGTITNCYYNKDICTVGGIGGSDAAGSATGLTTSDLCSAFSSDGIWKSGDYSDNDSTADCTLPSLIGVGEAIHLYNFGTSDSPDWQLFTEITTAKQFKAIVNDSESWGKNYVLGADIDLGGEKITPIGKGSEAFTGKFSGDGHTVSNFKIVSREGGDIGLFGNNDGTIMNLGVKNAEISVVVNDRIVYVGGVCGENTGTIQNCYNTGTVSGSVGTVSGSAEINDFELGFGGVCGYNWGKIQNCYNTGTVSGTNYVGGVCGYNWGKIQNCYNTGAVNGNKFVCGVCGYNKKTIQNCYNTGAVSGTKYVGGVCGDNGYTIQNCYNTGAVSGTEYVGSVCGYNNGGTITNCYYNKDICASGGIGFGEGSAAGLTTEELCSGKLDKLAGFEESVWEPGKSSDVTPTGGRFGTKTYTYPSLKGVGSAATADVAVYNFDIDGNDDWQLFTEITTADQFKAIVNDSESWGKNYVLGDKIDLGSEKITPIGNSYNPFTGKFSGNGHTVSNYIIDKLGNCIGLFGYNKGTIMNLGVEKAEISNESVIVGGVCGENHGTIMNCFNTGAVSGTDNVGGVCGENYGTIQNCYNTGAVKGEYNVGGVCGYNDGGDTIQNCYNTGAVSGTKKVGGVCGYNVSGCTIENCYNTGAVSGTEKVGSVCGYNDGTITNCYYNTDFCTFGGINGSDVDDSAAGLTTLQMTDVNALETMGFDKTIWEKKANDTKNGIAYYPSLKESGYQPSVEFTKKLELEQVGDKTPVYGDKIEFRTKALLTFINAFDGEDITVEDTAGGFKVQVNRETLSVTDSKFEYTANTAGEVTFTLVYKDGSSDYFPEEYSEDVDVTIKQKELTAADFTFAPAADLEFDNTAKEITVTAIPDGVGKITVKYYAGDNETQPINAGDYTVKIDVAEGDFYKSAQDLTAADWTFTIAKGTQSVTADDVSLTYGETGKITASTNGDGTISYTVKTGSDVVSVAADGTITTMKAGTATVEITAAETDNYAKAVKAVTVTINKAAVKITAKSYTIKVGAALPIFDYEVTGLVNGERLPITVTIFCTAADSNTAGTFPITVSGAADSDNYTFSYLNGTLTVSEKEPVSTPVFSPASGTTFTSSQKITITCATEGAAIYFTTDGTEPTTASTLYNGAFTITATTTIKAIAVKEGMADSAVATAAYTKRSSSGSSGGTGGGSSRPTTPTEPENPSIGGSAKSWSDIAADLAKLANGSEVTIQLNGNTTVPVEVIKVIDNKYLKVHFTVDSSRGWFVNGAEITAPAAADFSFIRTANQKHGGLRGIEGTQFRINNTGVPTGLEIAFKSEHAGKFANLYKSVDGKLVFVTCAKLGTDGKALLPGVTEKGDYIVMLCEFSDLPGDMSNDGILNAVDASAILKDIVGLESGANPLMADFNGDGNVNAVDASAVLKRIVGLI